jgi:hypothetical protein
MAAVTNEYVAGLIRADFKHADLFHDPIVRVDQVHGVIQDVLLVGFAAADCDANLFA